MSSQLIASHRETAEIVTDEALCKKKSKEILKKYNFPTGLLPLDEITEIGHNMTTGFMWIIQKKKKEHTFTAINRKVLYDTEITAFIEDRKLKKLSGIKTRELLIWVSPCDVRIDSVTGKLTFRTSAGLSKTFPVSAFEEDEEEKKEDNFPVSDLKKGEKKQATFPVSKEKKQDNLPVSVLEKEEKKEDNFPVSALEEKEKKQDNISVS